MIGLSSGHLAVGTKGDFALYPLHSKAIRSIHEINDKILTCGNDGKVYLTNKSTMDAVEVSSALSEKEYLFALDVLDEDKFITAGTNIVAECI